MNASNLNENKRYILMINVILYFLVIASLVVQIFRNNWNNVFLCAITLVLFTIPYFVNKKLQINLPNVLQVIVLLFIFSSEILGEIQNFYGIFKHWDTILHTLNGFLCAAIGFALIDILNNTEKFHIHLSPVFVALVAICFSMTIGVLWEFCEFGVDTFLNQDMQKDSIVSNITSVSFNDKNEKPPISINNIEKTVVYYWNNDGELLEKQIAGGYLDLGLKDTMKDLIVNFIGAIIFSIIGLLYIKDRDKYKFIEKFLLSAKKEGL